MTKRKEGVKYDADGGERVECANDRTAMETSATMTSEIAKPVQSSSQGGGTDSTSGQ